MNAISSDEMPAVVPPIALGALFLKFLRFGCLAFGGPVAQIAMIRQALVADERWIDSARFNRLLAVMQVLPGPEAHELCVHFGMMARGRIGGVLAGLGFMLPGFVLTLLAAWLYVGWLDEGVAAAAVLTGVQIAVVAVIVRAVARIGEHVLADRLLWLVAALGFAATLAGVPFWVALLGGGLAYASTDRRIAAVALAGTAAVGVALALAAGDAARAPATTPGATAVTLAALFVAGLKGGLLTFGGAYTAIPYVRHDTVGRGWLSDATFLDGVAVAGLLPAPLVIFATFVGYVAGGVEGAVAITLGMFLPAFAFSLIFFERLEAVTDHPRLTRLLAGVAAAVVGVIAATSIQLGVATAGRSSEPLVGAAIFAIALTIAWRVRGAWVTPAILAGGAATGWLLLSA